MDVVVVESNQENWVKSGKKILSKIELEYLS